MKCMQSKAIRSRTSTRIVVVVVLLVVVVVVGGTA